MKTHVRFVDNEGDEVIAPVKRLILYASKEIFNYRIVGSVDGTVDMDTYYRLAVELLGGGRGFKEPENGELYE
jgi:hypothetical protein